MSGSGPYLPLYDGEKNDFSLYPSSIKAFDISGHLSGEQPFPARHLRLRHARLFRQLQKYLLEGLLLVRVCLVPERGEVARRDVSPVVDYRYLRTQPLGGVQLVSRDQDAPAV